MIEELIARMAALLESLQAAGDQRRYFHATYQRTTIAVAERLREGGFDDPGWVERWDVAFADLYLDALQAGLAGRRPPRPWEAAFSAPADLSPVRHVLLGMNAHINYDLPQALLAVITDEEFADPALLARRESDHRAIDEVLASRVGAEGDELAGVSGPGSSLDRLLAPLNRRGTRRFLREAREKVWANAVALSAARARGPETYASALSQLAELSAAKVTALQAPGQVLLKLAATGFGVRLKYLSGPLCLLALFPLVIACSIVSGSSFIPDLEGHVGKRKLAALTVGAAALAAGVVAAVAPAGSAAAKPAATAASTIAIAPGVVHPLGVVSTPSQANCEKEGFYRCLTPEQVESAYNLAPLFSRGITGRGETIVIVDSFGSPTISHDLGVFDKQFGLPAPPSFKIITPSGKIPKWNKSDSDMTGWGGETTLDVEYAHAIAPGANILLVETPVSETEGVTGFPQIVEAENYVLKHHLGDVISQSFSATEETFAGLRQIDQYHLRSAYVTAANEKDGPTVLAASGDSGVADVELNGSTYYTYRVTSWPDSDPLVTGVGGTELVAGSRGTFTSVAWNDTYNKHLGDGTVPYATGGGLSVLFTRPSYQNGVAAKVVGSARGVPDVSMSGSCSAPVFTYQSFPQAGTPAGWYPSCGTSEATPEFAGIVALADQVAGHALGVINPTLYKLSAEKAPGVVPVTSGNNTVTFVQNKKTYTIKGFPARAGYSLDDGVGTVNAWYLAYELAGKTPPK